MKAKKAVSIALAAAMALSLLPIAPGLGVAPASALNGTASYTPAESDLTEKYWVSASADSGEAANAIDGDLQTVWAPEGAGPHYLTVDLGGAYDAVRKVQVAFKDADAANGYALKGSADGETWQILSDRTGNARLAAGFTDVFSVKGLRYVRLEPNAGVAVRELDVINYLRDDMDNGSDTSGFTSNTTNYNAGGNPPAPDGIRGGTMNEASKATGQNFFGLTKDMGWDTIRLRIWNEPRSEGSWQSNMITEDSPLENFPVGDPTGNCSPTATRTVAEYVKGAGQNLAIDFHYADSWSDPQNQPKPYAWADLPFESADPETNDLVKQTYAFTYEMIESLIAQGTAPTIVALGNEITNGMMWGSEYALTNPYAHFHDYYKRFIRGNENAARGGGVKWIKYEEAEGDKESAAYAEFLDSIVHLAKLVDAGNRAIAALNAKYDLDIQTEMHFAFNVFEQPSSGKVALDPAEVSEKVLTLVGGLADNLGTMGGMVDRIGVSYYPDWHGTYDQVQRNIMNLSEMLPGVKFNIAECSPSAQGTVNNWMDNPNHEVGFQYSTQSQGDDTMDIMKLINDIPNNAGMGVWPWNGQSVYFTSGQPRASFKVFSEAFATGVVESAVYATTTAGTAPALPATVSELNVATGAIDGGVAVEWEQIPPESYAQAGGFTVSGTAAAAGNMSDVTAYVTVMPSGTTDPEPIGDGREIDFNDGWQFFLATRTPTPQGGGANVAEMRANFAASGLADAGGVTTAEAIDPAFDDSGWRTVSVPHDFSIEGQKVSSGSNSQAYLEGGLAWYRKTFSLPEEYRGSKKVAIDFEGVYQDSVVYLNGVLIGNYPSGYTGFAYDLTENLKFGDDGENVIVVKVQNMAPSGRWYTGSGIVRPVKLVVTNYTRIVRNGWILGSPNLKQELAEDGGAELSVSAKMYSDDSNGVVSIRTTVYDGDTVVATHTNEPEDINPSTQKTMTDTLAVPNAKLWTMESPFRYKVVTEVIYSKNGGAGPEVTDTVEGWYGFRYVEFDSEKGLFLNGKQTKLQGVDLHHDSGSLGAAAYYDGFRREMLILKGMGVNAYRTSHNPPAKEIIEVCSELGIVVMEEAYDGWGSAKASYDFGAFFLLPVPEGFAGQLGADLPANAMWSDWVVKEMALRDINEPSVIMWSIGNEVRGVGTRPSWYNWNSYLRAGLDDYEKPSNYTATTFNEYTEALRLRNDLLDVDGSRLIAMGGDQQRTPATTTSTWGLVNQALDGYGLNYNTAPSVDGLIERFPDTFFFESESSSQTGARGVYFSPSLANTPPNQTPGNRGTSAYDNNFSSWTMPNEYGLKKDRDREAFIGQFIWSGFDYLGEPTPFGVYPVGVSSFGTVDTAGFPKDSYYLFKSQWTSEPMAHIVPMNWNDWQLGEDVEVWAYTNAIKAELFLNGRSLGVRSFDEKTTEFGLDYYETTEPTKDGSGSGYKTGADTNPDNPGGYVSPNGSYGKLHLTWHVPFEPGELKLVAMDKAGAPVAEDSLKTAKQAYAVELSAFEPQASENGLAYITAKVVDENGVMLPSANNLIKFDVSGNGLIVGVDNGKQESAELYKWGNVDESAHSERSAYNGLALAIVKAGDLGDGSSFTLKASADNLFAAEIDVPVAAKGGTAEAPVQTRQLPKGELVSLAAKSVKAAKGSPIALPRDVLATYASGETRILKATWDSVPNESYAEAGTFEVEGSIEGVAQKAKISVTVAAAPFAKDYGLNTAAGAQDIVSADGALATASFTSGTNYPNYMLNGNTTNQWDNYAAAGQTVVLNAVNAARASDWVATYWPSEKTLSSISLYFTTNANYALPATINVQYWDGTEWANASNQAVAYATASNQATTVAFDSVATAKVRAVMTSAAPFDATTGRLRIVKFESYGPDFEAGGELAELAEALAGAIAEAGALTEADYTPATWQRLSQAVGAATTLLSGGGATAELLQAAIAEIAAATAELDEVADKAALAAQLALAEAITDISKYTEASALTFTAALSEAQSVMNDPNATQDEATAAATELELALSGLTLKTEPGDSAALESMLDSAIAIETDLFTVESAGALELAIDAAQELAADATQEELNGALADISGAIGGLVLKDEFEPYAQLTDLLIEIAQMDGTLYTKPSWDALQAVVAEAWAFLADIIAEGEPYEPASEPIDGEDAEGEQLQPLLSFADARMQELIVALTEKLNELKRQPSAAPGGQREITGGVYALSDKKTMYAEEINEGELAFAEFEFKGIGLQQIGTLALSLTYKADAVSAHDFALPAGDPQVNDEWMDLVSMSVAEGTPRIEGYRTFNIVIYAKEGIKHFSVADGEPLLNVKLTAATNEYRTMSLLLSWLDAAYYDDDYEGGNEGLQAAETLSPSLASTILDIWSRFDVNRDGKISILDLNAVRQHMGQTKDPITGWASPLLERCDLGGDQATEPGKDLPDGVIDTADLTLIMAKYNSLI